MESNFTIEDNIKKPQRGSQYNFETIPYNSGMRFTLTENEDLKKLSMKIRNAVGVFKKNHEEFKTLSVHVLKDKREIMVYRSKEE